MSPLEMAANQAPNLMQNYGGPVGLAGKLLGLGKEEIDAGVPWWSWLGVGIVVGGIITYASREKLERLLE